MKKLIAITDHNFHDYLKMDYGKRLVRTAAAADLPFDGDSPYVVKFRQWVIGQSLKSREFDFDITRHDAAVCLDLLADAVDEEEGPAATHIVRAARGESKKAEPPARPKRRKGE
jgi:hypothetical protein